MNDLFDLNIEQVLEHWELEHALREIIANALDEQTLTKTKKIEIYEKDGNWHIRDYGRGLQYIHFTQNENKEKLNSPFLIGKFGVGLKDALAVFYRKGVNVEIDSKYAHISLIMARKSGFNVRTLHASFSDPKDTSMVGTDFTIYGISEETVEKAKSMFLYFDQNAVLLEKTKYGEVYQNGTANPSYIYINGVQVATEDNFMFTYNITNINAQIKKAINRERTNVGRSAYSNTIKMILRQCKSDKVLITLVEDLKNIMTGTNHDESGWEDVATYAAKTLNESGEVVFMTPSNRDDLSNQQLEILKNSGKKLIMITDKVYSKISEFVITFKDVYDAYEKNFQYKFIDYSDLTQQEQLVFDTSKILIDFLEKNNYKNNANIKISETIQVDSSGRETLGLCLHDENTIIIKRSVLVSKEKFLGILAHEFAHYHSHYPDNSRDFENVLTDMLGYALCEIVSNITDLPQKENRTIKKIKGFFGF